MDLSKLTIEELEKLQKNIKKHIESRKKQQKEVLLKEFKAKAKEQGLTLDDILGKKTTKKQIVKAEPKYKNEDGATWSGRGQKPKWLADALESGKKIEDFLIKK